MLLSTLTANLQSSYAAIQSQIEALQEQQRLIQTQLQRVGSVESKMESAAALVAEAIAEIKDVCPAELGNYEATITSLFQSPVAQIQAGTDTPEEPQPQEDSVSPNTDIPEEVEAVEAEVVDAEPTEEEEAEEVVDAEPTEEEEEAEEADDAPASDHPSHQASPRSLHKSATKPLAWLAAKRGIDTTNMKRYQIASALVGQVTQDELQEAIAQTTMAG